MLLPRERLRRSLIEKIPSLVKTRDDKNVMKTGTTAFAFYYQKGTIVAADSRTTCGNIIFQHNARKVYKIGKNSLMTAAGTCAYIYFIKDTFLQHIGEYQIESDDRELSLSGQAELLEEILQTISMFMSIESNFILAGYDTVSREFKIFQFDELGGKYFINQKQKVAAIGSGGEIAMAIIKSDLGAKRSVNLQSAKNTAVKAIVQSAHQDSASEPPVINKPTIFRIEKNGIKMISDSSSS